MSADLSSELSSNLTSSTNRPFLGPASSFSSHPPHQPPPIIPPPSSQVSDSVVSDSYMASAMSLSDYPALPFTRARGRACRRSPTRVSSSLPPSKSPWVPSISPALMARPTRHSSRVGHTPKFLVNQYHLDMPKLMKTAQANAASGPMLRCESADMGSNSSLIFFSSGLYTAIVHPTLFSPPHSWAVGANNILFEPTSIEGDLNLTHTKVQILCSLLSPSSVSKVTLSLYPTTHKIVLQGKTIPSWFTNQVLGAILTASASSFTHPQLELLEQAIASFQPPPSPPPPPQSPPVSEEPVSFGSTDIRYRHTPTKGI